MQIEVKRSGVEFMPDPSRIIARFLFTGEKRASKTIASVLSMSNKDASITLGQILRDYSLRHRNISKIFERHFNRVSYLLKPLNVDPASLDIALKILIGAYFTCEYSIESAAFFNPSIIEHPDQSELEPGAKRIIISFRATGEGHISSIVFRAGVLDKGSNLQIEPTGKMLEEAEHIRRNLYEKSSFRNKLDEMHTFHSAPPVDAILDNLNDSFTYGELRRCVDDYKSRIELNIDKEAQLNQIIWLASSHYELDFSLDTNLSERVIFPVSARERNGIEDARFVKFTDDDGKTMYYATYTAYDGTSILPKMLNTNDFYHFRISPIHGEIAQNKGMALFPRKVNGKYAMLCRLDGVNNYIAYSDQLTVWREAKLLQEPKFPWEFVQIGNCGSPIETADGWLVITHGVGAMREYVLGAALFDLNDPELEIGRLSSPLLIPNADEREGYVPNVVYSCGSMIHNDDLIIPYAMSDYASTYASINLQELLDELKTSE
jgi:predicted GH43/DUF377 family glycosyl hydrolase